MSKETIVRTREDLHSYKPELSGVKASEDLSIVLPIQKTQDVVWTPHETQSDKGQLGIFCYQSTQEEEIPNY